MRFYTCLLLLTTIHATTWENRGDVTCEGGYKKRLDDGTVECETSCSRSIFRDTYKDAEGNKCCSNRTSLCVQIKEEFELECGSCGSCFDKFRSNGMNYAKLDFSSWTNLAANSPLRQKLNDPNYAFTSTTTYIIFDSTEEVASITKEQPFVNNRIQIDCTDPELAPFCISCEYLCNNPVQEVMISTITDPHQTYCFTTGATCDVNSDCEAGDECTNDFQDLIAVIYINNNGDPMHPFIIDGAEIGEALTQEIVKEALNEHGAEAAVANIASRGYTNVFACWAGEMGECPGTRRRNLLQDEYGNSGERL